MKPTEPDANSYQPWAGFEPIALRDPGFWLTRPRSERIAEATRLTYACSSMTPVTAPPLDRVVHISTLGEPTTEELDAIWLRMISRLGFAD